MHQEPCPEDIFEITPQAVLQAYALGIFPMAEDADSDQLYWIEPPTRGIFPIGGFHVPRSLERLIRQGRFTISFNQSFDAVLAGCAAMTKTRPTTWINQRIKELYQELHLLGYAHSVEVWRDKNLVGGLYGIALGGGVLW